jgi:hypothetical protein
MRRLFTESNLLIGILVQKFGHRDRRTGGRNRRRFRKRENGWVMQGSRSPTCSARSGPSVIRFIEVKDAGQLVNRVVRVTATAFVITPSNMINATFLWFMADL